MVKKRGNSSRSKSHVSKQSSSRLETKIIENLTALQKVNLDLAEKFDSLTKQLSGLLELFENAAKSFGHLQGPQISEKDKEFLDKVDKLLEQNKTIAKGLTLMEEKMRDKISSSQTSPERSMQQIMPSRSAPNPSLGREDKWTKSMK